MKPSSPPPSFKVLVEFTVTKQKELTITAQNPEHAAKRACGIIKGWEGVAATEAKSVVEVEE